VGCFAANGYGLFNMSGNVWEWTRSLWGMDFDKLEFTYPYDPKDSQREDLAAGYDQLRVVRGGSWNNTSDNARCAYRNMNKPENRNNNLGFRVVLRSAHVLPALLLVSLFRRDDVPVHPHQLRSGNAGRSVDTG
jgi:formylglycine-generating enzyme required for sulfatase activity